MKRWTTALPGLLLVLTACSDQGVESIESVQLPEDMCDLVPESQVTQWNLHVDSRATKNDQYLSSGRCAMTGDGPAGDVLVSLVVTTHGGVAAESASESASDDAADRADEDLDSSCDNVQSYGGTYLDLGSSCTATVRADGVAATVAAVRLPDIHAVAWVSVSTPVAEAEEGAAAASDLVSAVQDQVVATSG